MAAENGQGWFEGAWAFREETRYPKLFGSLGPGIYPLDADLFTSVFRQESFDPRWLSLGVFECAPTMERASWVYVSSGLSTTWESSSPEPDKWSGLGCEFIMQSPRQAQWALLLLRKMVAFQILLACGKFPGKPVLAVGDRIPLRSPIDGASSKLTWALVASSQEFPDVQQIPSGRFQFFQFIGITEEEAEYARGNSSKQLTNLLAALKLASTTEPSRESVAPTKPSS
jgi:Suppressor of fused protein (SUFU)